MVPFLPSLQTEYTVRRVAGAEHGEKEPSLFLSTHRLSAEVFRAKSQWKDGVSQILLQGI